MVPSLLTLAGALAALGVVAGEDYSFWKGLKASALHSLRGGRRLQGDFCNSIGCPAGYTPITDAQFVECDGTCQASQCCEAFCSYHACPDNYVPIDDAATTMCDDDSGCTDALCCVSGTSSSVDSVSVASADNVSYLEDETVDDDGDDLDDDVDDNLDADLDEDNEEGVFCNSIGCSNGYTPIEDAQSTLCDGGVCSESQCCEAFCSYHACPSDYVPITDASTTLCDDSGCTDALCCVSNMSTSAGSGDSTTLLVDDDATADSTAFLADDDADDNAAADSTAFLADDDAAAAADNPEVMFCNSIACSEGYTPIEDAQSTVCNGDTCEESQCCEAFCSYHACPNDYVPITDAATTMCADSGCTDAFCCATLSDILSASLGSSDDYSYSFSDDDYSSYSYSFSS